MDYIEKDYSEYNYWANKRIATWLKKISIDVVKSQIKSSYPSIYFTLHHILTTEKYWLSKILEKKMELPDIMEESLIFEVFTNESKIFNESIQQLTKEDFSREVEMDIKAKGIQLEGKYSVTELIHHCINHSTYHRGQIVTIARTLGIEDEIPSTDYFIFKMNKQIGAKKRSS